MRDKVSARYVTAYTDEHGVKHIAPYSLIQLRGNTKMKRNDASSFFDETILDELTVPELQYQGTANLENEHNELAKTPSTERKGVFDNG